MYVFTSSPMYKYIPQNTELSIWELLIRKIFFYYDPVQKFLLYVSFFVVVNLNLAITSGTLELSGVSAPLRIARGHTYLQIILLADGETSCVLFPILISCTTRWYVITRKHQVLHSQYGRSGLKKAKNG